MLLLQQLMQLDLQVLMQVIASHYYSRRTGKLQRSFLKTSIAVDTDKKVILGWKISQKTDHDVKHAKALIRQSNKSRKSECYVLDKGYDS